MGNDKVGKSNDVSAVMQRHQSSTSDTEMDAKKRSKNPSRELGVAPLAEKSLLGTQSADQKELLLAQDTMLTSAVDPASAIGAGATVVSVGLQILDIVGAFDREINGSSISGPVVSFPKVDSLVGKINDKTERKVLTVNYSRPQTNKRGMVIGRQVSATTEIGIRGRFGEIDPEVAKQNNWPCFVYLRNVEFVIMKSEGWDHRSLEIEVAPGDVYGKMGFENIGNDLPRIEHIIKARVKRRNNIMCEFEGDLLTTHVKSFFSNNQTIDVTETDGKTDASLTSYDDSAGHSTITVTGPKY